MPTWGPYYWPFWLIVAGLLFLGPEVIGLLTNTANTLSEYLWHELHVGLSFGAGRHTAAWWVSLLAWIIGTCVLTAHIWWRQI